MAKPKIDAAEEIVIIRIIALFSVLKLFPIIREGNSKKLIVYKKPSPYKDDISGKVKRIKSKRDRSLVLRILTSMVLLLMAFLFKK